MLRLRENTPPWNLHNKERWVMFDAEYFSLQSWYSKTMGDTIRFLEKDWDTVRSQVQGMSFYDLFDVARKVGGGKKKSEGKRRYQIMWPREMAWAFMSIDGSKSSGTASRATCLSAGRS